MIRRTIVKGEEGGGGGQRTVLYAKLVAQVNRCDSDRPPNNKRDVIVMISRCKDRESMVFPVWFNWSKYAILLTARRT